MFILKVLRGDTMWRLAWSMVESDITQFISAYMSIFYWLAFFTMATGNVLKFHIFSRFFDEFCQFDVFVNKSKTIEGRCFKLCIIIRLWRTHHSHCFVDLPGLCGCHGNGILILFMCIHYNSLWANGSTLFSDSFWLLMFCLLIKKSI